MAASVKRNIRLYPWYIASFNAHFWLPIFFLYFNSLFSLDDVLLLEAVYYGTVVVFELPSGYFSDMVGRRLTLLIATIAVVVAHALFFLGSTFPVFALAQICLAIASSFNSGTDTSLHFDSLAALGRQSEFANREAKAARNMFLAGALTAVIGGGVALFHFRLAYGLSLLAGLVSFALIVAMREPPASERRSPPQGFLHQLWLCARLLRQPSLLWLSSFSIFMIVLNHVPYEFYQPYIKLQMTGSEFFASTTPVTTGIVTALTMVLASFAAAKSVRLRDRLGLAPGLLLAALIQITVIFVMGMVSHPIVIALILLRTCPRALITAPIRAAIAPRVPQAQRATFLSLQSLFGRLSFSGLLVLLSILVGPNSQADYAHLSRALLFCAAAGVLGFVLLAIGPFRGKRMDPEGASNDGSVERDGF